jgi:hypothetical protein
MGAEYPRKSRLNPRAREPYKIVYFQKGTGNAVLPVRLGLRAEKKNLLRSGSANAGSPRKALAPHREIQLAASNLLVVRVDASVRRRIRTTGRIPQSKPPSGTSRRVGHYRIAPDLRDRTTFVTDLAIAAPARHRGAAEDRVVSARGASSFQGERHRIVEMGGIRLPIRRVRAAGIRVGRRDADCCSNPRIGGFGVAQVGE